MMLLKSRLKALLLLLIATNASAGVLPEDRFDVLLHSYDGGGIKIDGPSLLVRKSVGEKMSFSGSYYVDTISSASIDVVTTGASPDGYKEERTQYGAGVDYLRGDTTMSFGYSTSEENDYQADTLNFAISQDVFGGLTTITLGYGSGADEVSRRGDATFSEDVDRHAYRLGVTQVITRNLILGLSYEAVADEGFLNNPYRQVRYVDPGDPTNWLTQPELYPETRASNAVAIRGKYHLPYRAAVSGEYRFFTDDWGIDAHTFEAGYVQPFRTKWLFDFKYRFYTQSAADFYSDLFPYANAQNFLARDKELSTFQSHGPHLGVTYTFLDRQGDWPLKGTLNFAADYYMFNYDDFRDLRSDSDPGTEPFYNFDAQVFQAFFSLWF
ncbi:MAG: DUF3570 domain-containing protein [Gammaproteobacteria bacterium]